MKTINGATKNSKLCCFLGLLIVLCVCTRIVGAVTLSCTFKNSEHRNKVAEIIKTYQNFPYNNENGEVVFSYNPEKHKEPAIFYSFPGIEGSFSIEKRVPENPENPDLYDAIVRFVIPYCRKSRASAFGKGPVDVSDIWTFRKPLETFEKNRHWHLLITRDPNSLAKEKEVGIQVSCDPIPTPSPLKTLQVGVLPPPKCALDPLELEGKEGK